MPCLIFYYIILLMIRIFSGEMGVSLAGRPGLLYGKLCAEEELALWEHRDQDDDSNSRRPGNFISL